MKLLRSALRDAKDVVSYTIIFNSEKIFLCGLDNSRVLQTVPAFTKHLKAILTSTSKQLVGLELNSNSKIESGIGVNSSGTPNPPMPEGSDIGGMDGLNIFPQSTAMLRKAAIRIAGSLVCFNVWLASIDPFYFLESAPSELDDEQRHRWDQRCTLYHSTCFCMVCVVLVY